jgi:hypothetical protein
VWAAIIAILGCVPLVHNVRFPAMRFPMPALLAIVGVAYGGFVFACFVRRRPGMGLIAMGGGMIAVMALIFGLYLPRAEFLRLSVDLGETLKRNGGGASDTRPGDVQMIAYKEPSLAFYQGGTIREQSENDFLLTHPPDQWPRFLVIREDIWSRMPADVKAKWDDLGSSRGLDLADKARTWTVHVLRKREE